MNQARSSRLMSMKLGTNPKGLVPYFLTVSQPQPVVPQTVDRSIEKFYPTSLNSETYILNPEIWRLRLCDAYILKETFHDR